MNSPIYNEWVEEERKEAAEKAAKEATKMSLKKSLVELLTEKFDFVPKAVRDSIRAVRDGCLYTLHRYRLELLF